MITSFPAADDRTLLDLILSIKKMGADVDVSTEESSRKSGSVRRHVTIEWDAHYVDGRIF